MTIRCNFFRTQDTILMYTKDNVKKPLFKTTERQKDEKENFDVNARIIRNHRYCFSP